MTPYIPTLFVALTSCAFSSFAGAATVSYIIGDGLPSDGTATTNAYAGIPQTSTTYTPNRTEPTSDLTDPSHLLMTSVVWSAVTDSEVALNGNWDPYYVGDAWGNNTDYRTVITVDLSGITLPTSDIYDTTALELWLEVSTTTTTGVIDFYQGDHRTTDFSSSSAPASIGSTSTAGMANSNFYPFVLDPSILDLNTDTTLTFTMATSDADIKFGSDYRQNGSVTGTANGTPAPFLLINAESVAPVPEPSAAILLLASGLLTLRRRR